MAGVFEFRDKFREQYGSIADQLAQVEEQVGTRCVRRVGYQVVAAGVGENVGTIQRVLDELE